MNSLSMLLQAAPAGASQAGGGSMAMTLITFGLVFVIFYLFIIRPQNKQKKETEKMIAALKKGDVIVTIGGIHGTISSTKEKTVIVKVDDNCKMEFSRAAISSVIVPEKEEKISKSEKESEKKETDSADKE